MTKLEELINNFYKTEGLSLREHISDIFKESEDDGEIIDELASLLHHLNLVVH